MPGYGCLVPNTSSSLGPLAALTNEEFRTKAAEFIRRQVGRASENYDAAHLAGGLSGATRTRELYGRRILVLSMRDWSVHVQVEALIAQSLRLHGADVTMLSCGGGLEICDRVNTWEGPPMPCRTCSKYVRDSLQAHGLDLIDLKAELVSSEWPELDGLDLSGLRQVSYRGLPLGRLVDIPVKWFLTAESLHLDPLGLHTYRTFLRSARRVADAAINRLDEIAPDHVVMLNGLFLFESIVAEICRQRSIHVTTYERAFMPGTFFFSEDDNAGFLRMDRVWDEWRDLPLTDSEDRELETYLADRKLGVRTGDNYWVSVDESISDRKHPGRRAVLFTNLVWDSAVVDQNVAFPSIVDWIAAAIEAFRDRPSDELIIRIHPAEVKLAGRESRERMLDRVTPLVGDFPSNVTIIPAEDNTSSYVLMDEADFGLVYSSTTGMEMALAGKPVVVAARTHYRNRGFTVDVTSPDEFGEAITRLCADPSTWAPDLELARRYAHLFFFKAPFVDLGVSEPIRGLVKIDAETGNDLRTPGYARIVAAIAGNGDYLPRPANVVAAPFERKR